MSPNYIDAVVYCAVATILCVFFVAIIAVAFHEPKDDSRRGGGGMVE